MHSRTFMNISYPYSVKNVCPFGGDLAGQSRVHCQKFKLKLCLEYSFAGLLRAKTN